MSVAELTKQRSEIASEIRSLGATHKANGNKWENAKQAERFNALSEQYDELTKDISMQTASRDIHSRLDTLDRDDGPYNPLGIGLQDQVADRSPLASSGQASHKYVVDSQGRRQPMLGKSDSLCAWLQKEQPDTARQHANLPLGEYLRSMVGGSKTPEQFAALQEGSDSAGGHTVPTLLSAQLIDLMRAKSRVVQAGAQTITLDSERNRFAKLASDPVPAWRNENSQVAESEPTFGLIEFQAKSLAMLTIASEEVLADSLNIRQALPNLLTQAMAQEVDRVALAGSGTDPEPRGVMNMPGIATISMGTNGAPITDYSPMLDAFEAIETSNADEPTAAIMHPRTSRQFAGLTDSTGQPLRRPTTLENAPMLTTTKLPIDETQGTADDASSIIVGDFTDLVLAMRSQVRVTVLRERYMDKLQYGFLTTLRMDVGAWHEQSFAKITGVTPTA